jgi:hypothetical protein
MDCPLKEGEMTTSIRGSHQVDGAFKKLTKRFEATQKKINASAAKRMKTGQYEAATKWMEIGRAFEAFLKKIELIQQEWHELLASSQRSLDGVETKKVRPHKEGSPRTKGAKSRISTKRLYAPALKALLKHGGEASSDEMLGDLHKYVLNEFPESDLVVNVPFNFPPWQKTIRKTHRYFQNEGWIERRKDGQWKITEKGRSAAAE